MSVDTEEEAERLFVLAGKLTYDGQEYILPGVDEDLGKMWEAGERLQELYLTVIKKPQTQPHVFVGKWNTSPNNQCAECGEGREHPVHAPSRRGKFVDGCPTCEQYKAQGLTFFPSHDPSPRCESGGHPHCTCDICF